MPTVLEIGRAGLCGTGSFYPGRARPPGSPGGFAAEPCRAHGGRWPRRPGLVRFGLAPELAPAREESARPCATRGLGACRRCSRSVVPGCAVRDLFYPGRARPPWTPRRLRRRTLPGPRWSLLRRARCGVWFGLAPELAPARENPQDPARPGILRMPTVLRVVWCGICLPREGTAPLDPPWIPPAASPPNPAGPTVVAGHAGLDLFASGWRPSLRPLAKNPPARPQESGAGAGRRSDRPAGVLPPPEGATLRL